LDEIIIRDPKDKIIVSDALITEADILITGDKDFFDRKYGNLEILKPAEFMEKYINKKESE
jgi:predicted nucleic acid-binding protein